MDDVNNTNWVGLGNSVTPASSGPQWPNFSATFPSGNNTTAAASYPASSTLPSTSNPFTGNAALPNNFFNASIDNAPIVTLPEGLSSDSSDDDIEFLDEKISSDQEEPDYAKTWQWYEKNNGGATMANILGRVTEITLELRNMSDWLKNLKVPQNNELTAYDVQSESNFLSCQVIPRARNATTGVVHKLSPGFDFDKVTKNKEGQYPTVFEVVKGAAESIIQLNAHIEEHVLKTLPSATEIFAIRQVK